MTMFIIQSALLILIAFILGCILGCLLRRWFGDQAIEESVAVAAPAVAVASVAAQKPAPKAKPATRKPRTRKAAVAKKAPAKKRTSTAKAATKDDLKRIRGVGRQNEARLNADGVQSFAQIAAWTKKEQREIGERLAFPGRIEREDWVKQAKVLAKGQETAFSKRVKKGDVDSSSGKGTVGDLGKKPRTLAKARAKGPDNLTLIDGVGNAIEKRLFGIGIFHFDQIAKWTADNETWAGIMVGFPGRSEREGWVKEAKTLAAGGSTAHSRKVEAGKIATSRKSTKNTRKTK